MSKLETKIIRWGILGLGHIAQKFAQDLASVHGAQLYSVASRSPQRPLPLQINFMFLLVMVLMSYLLKIP